MPGSKGGIIGAAIGGIVGVFIITLGIVGSARMQKTSFDESNRLTREFEEKWRKKGFY